MTKTPLMLASLAALALAMPLGAQEKSRTKTFAGDKYTASQTTTVNRDTGTATRTGEATNIATGKTATSIGVRQRTDNGATVSLTQTGTQGRTRSLEGERVRSDNGSTFTGTATGRGGQTYGLAGSRSRDRQGNSQASQSVANAAGQTLAARDRVTTRSNGQISSTVTKTRAEGSSRPPRGRGRRG
jgi:hypothetical protein